MTSEPQENLSALEAQKAISEELDRVFDYHAPPDHIRILHERWRTVTKAFATDIMGLPPTRERAMAVTRLEEVAFWVHANIARNHGAFPEPPEAKDDDG